MSIELILFLLLFLVGLIIGSITEKRHFRSLEKREAGYINLPAVSFGSLPNPEMIDRTEFVMGSAVISIDYFKRIMAALRSIFGGSIRSYESLVDRARREAILRAKASAPDARVIVNLRVETSTIGEMSNKQTLGSVEALAYGTAVWTKE